MQGGGRQQEGAYEHMERALELRQRETAERRRRQRLDWSEEGAEGAVGATTRSMTRTQPTWRP